ncbi:hypothetical protein Cgig2_029496 [Carnegiea gigantea]|uniref:Glycine-rich protein n=1 Tax=Carnegiea gigantea TaxID=171969 RepID=A0A9Q1QKJ7_9CARY|nr:hypothetical protein Cgig2_029496 [Carnegiea gigantea]
MGLDMVFILMGELSFVMFDDDHDSMLDYWYDFRKISVVKSERPLWRVKTITDFFRSIINLIVVFFMTMFSMEKSDAYRKSSGASKKWDGGGGPGGGGRGPYGGGPPGPPRGGLDNVRGLRDVRGADHSKFLFLLQILYTRFPPVVPAVVAELLSGSPQTS